MYLRLAAEIDRVDRTNGKKALCLKTGSVIRLLLLLAVVVVVLVAI